MKVDRVAHLDQVFVQAKISVVEREHLAVLVPMISRFSNSQNKVNEADFAATDPWHLRLEAIGGDSVGAG